jgi:hypothetical protein
MMKLPPIENHSSEWLPTVIEGWGQLVEKTNRMKTKVGSSDAFERTLAALRDMASTGRFDDLRELLGHRLGARALTWLWLHDEVVGKRLFNARILDVLVEYQQPRLSRLTLIQLIQLYFRYFDGLDAYNKHGEDSLRKRLELHLLVQISRIPSRSTTFGADPLMTLNREGEWLLTLDGPVQLINRVRDEGGELTEAFEKMGLNGFDVGRYGDVCRAHYYLAVLRELSPGEWSDVLDELLKPEVSNAPYEDGRRIGHAALEIMIDRAGSEPGDAWQNFILSLAGDPRIASSSKNFREWWQPLGEERIGKVRGWLSKEDLRLFLQAVQQYGVESGKQDLQRMFPARKLFLEGLYRLGLIRHTRLMLGRLAKESVHRILGEEMKTEFARMDGIMNDKAVIYLDCGDFHLIEGSHSFKVWVYLAQPGTSLQSYERNHFTHSDLISGLPQKYRETYPSLPYEAIAHNGTWQRKVFEFLANNGIGLDLEQLLSRQEYRSYLSRFGIPVVRRENAQVLKTKEQSTWAAASTFVQAERGVVALTRPQQTGLNSAPRPSPQSEELHSSTISESIQPLPESWNDPLKDLLSHLGPFELNVLRYFATNPGDKVRYAANVLTVEAREINQVLYGRLNALCQQTDSFGWSVRADIAAALDRLPAGD